MPAMPAAPSSQTSMQHRIIPMPQLLEMAVSAHEAERYAEAEPLYRAMIAADPLYARAWLNLGVLLRQTDRLEASLAHLERARQLCPDSAAVALSLGTTLRMLDRVEEAEAVHRLGTQLDPDSGDAWFNFGSTLRHAGKLDEALAALDRASSLGSHSPYLGLERSLTHLVAGHWREGFEQYEARFEIPDRPKHHTDLPRWRGEELPNQALLVWAEQGMGDSLQFVRYLPLIRQRVGQVVFEVDPPLVSLLRAAPLLAGIEIVPFGASVTAATAQVPLLSLPALIEPDPARLATPSPYLVVPPQERRQLPGRMLNVGLAWAGKPTNTADRHRSLTIAAFAEVLGVPGITFHSLQKRVRQNEATEMGFGSIVHDLGFCRNEFMETAAAVEAMDLVITVDTSIGHVAGALGKPVWLLLAFSPDWRWGLSGERTKWYPSMRLFRQRAPGDWPELFSRLAGELEEQARRAPGWADVQARHQARIKAWKEKR